MQGIPTAERIGNVLRARGFPVATPPQYRQVLRGLGEEDSRLLAQHLNKIAAAVDDRESVAWVGNLTRVARGEVPGHEVLHLRSPVQAEPVAKSSSRASTPTKSQQEQRARERQTVHVYAAGGALCFELDKMRPDSTGRQYSTITVEGAAAIGRQQFDWDNKITVQLGLRELPMMVGAVMGCLPEWSVKAHGPDHNKSLRLRNQETGVHVFMTHGPAAVSIPMLHQDTYPVLSLALKALQTNDSHLTAETVLQLCTRAVGRPVP